MGWIACAVLMELAVGAAFYVSPTGNDAGPGSLAAPFRTLSKAQDVVRQLKKSKGLPEGGVTVYLTQGTHTVSSPIVLGPQDSGEPGKPIVYRSLPGQRAELSSGLALKGWQRPAVDPAFASVKAQGKLWVANVEPERRFYALFVDGQKMRRASSPSDDLWNKWPALRGGEPPTGSLGQQVQFRPGALDGLPINGDAEVVLLSRFRTHNSISPLRQLDPFASAANRLSRNPVGDGEAGDPYRLENSLQYIDEPGEWCLDSLRGKVYLWPKTEPLTDGRVVVPAATALVQLRGDDAKKTWVTNVRFLDIDFRMTDRDPEDRWVSTGPNPDLTPSAATLLMEGVENVAIEGCRIEQSGNWGLAIDGHALSCRIVGNEISDCGAGGIRLAGFGPGKRADHGRHTIERNWIHHVGDAPYWQSAGILLFGSADNRITLNHIQDVPRNGIEIVGPTSRAFNSFAETASDAFGERRNRWGIRWSELPAGSETRNKSGTGTFTPASAKAFQHASRNVIERNVIESFLTQLDDGGAVYATGCGTGNKIKGNAIRNGFNALQLHPIYLGVEADGFVVEDNQVWSPGTFKNDGKNTWQNNPISSSRFSSFDALKAAILDEIAQKGGWPGLRNP